MLPGLFFSAQTRATPEHPGARLRRFTLIISILFISAACTSNAPERSPPIPALESVAIESNGATRDLEARFGIAPEDSVIGNTTALGAGTGAAAGIGWAAVCGPYFFVCALAVVPTTMLLGGTAGGLAGSASDHYQMPPDDQLQALDKQFSEIYQQRTLHMDIRDGVEEQIPVGRLADPPEAEALVQLRLSDVRFTRTFSNKYQWSLKSVMVVTWNRNRGQTRHSYKIYDHTSTALPLVEWLQNDGEKLNRALDDCVEGLARQMAADLRFKN